jgi:hypothetical protein
MAQKVDIACVQLNEREPGRYDKSNPGYARRDKLDLAWEMISREMKEPGMYIFSN